jgi:hypothetical protein
MGRQSNKNRDNDASLSGPGSEEIESGAIQSWRMIKKTGLPGSDHFLTGSGFHLFVREQRNKNERKCSVCLFVHAAGAAAAVFTAVFMFVHCLFVRRMNMNILMNIPR